MSLLKDGKTAENKTAMIYGKNENPIFEFESEKLKLEFNSFQKHILEELINSENKDWTIVPPRHCGKTFVHDIFASKFIYEILYGATPSIDELLNFIGEALDSSCESPTMPMVSVEFIEPKERTISDIKKEIKHEKNPLRLKQLNKELNMKYKELKSG